MAAMMRSDPRRHQGQRVMSIVNRYDCLVFCYSGSSGGVANVGGTVTVTNSTIAGNAGGFGGGVANHGGTVTVTNSTIAGNATTPGSGGGVANYGGTLTVRDSTIAGNEALVFCAGKYCYGGSGGGVANYGGTLTVLNSTITGNSANSGAGGVASDGGTVTIENSTIAGNAGSGVLSFSTFSIVNSTIAGNADGGVLSFSTLSIVNSTITGNTASIFSVAGGVASHAGPVTIENSTIAGNRAVSAGGVWINKYSTFSIVNSTITGNMATARSGGVANYGGTLTLTRTLVTGNTAPIAPEIYNRVYYGSTLPATNYNLFGVNGTSGVVGFTPGPTDVVPPAGVQLVDILDPMLAHNGGLTQTHALVPGSPAIDAGGPDCTDATGDPLLTDQRNKPRPVDGNGDGTAVCDIGAFEFFPLVNDFVTLDPDLDTVFDPTPVMDGPAGQFTITATFTNTSATPLRFPFFTVTELSDGNLLLNADEGTMGVGATVPLVAEGDVLAPGETVAVDFRIGLQERVPFTFFVDLFAEPLP